MIKFYLRLLALAMVLFGVLAISPAGVYRAGPSTAGADWSGFFPAGACWRAFPTAEACWAGLSVEELVEQADLIVIGEIKGVAGEEKDGGSWKTYWEVEGQYYLKGDPAAPLLIVATPGAEHKQPAVSTHYRLNEWGDTVLLFLVQRKGDRKILEPESLSSGRISAGTRQKETREAPEDQGARKYQEAREIPEAPDLEPLSPQGVVALHANDFPPSEQPDGAYLLKKYDLIDEKIPLEDKEKLESYIAGLPQVTAAAPGAESGAGNEGLQGEKSTKQPKPKQPGGLLKQSASFGIIGGADGPTSLSVTGNPLKALLFPAIALAAVAFAGGFVLGYVTKARRRSK